MENIDIVHIKQKLFWALHNFKEQKGVLKPKHLRPTQFKIISNHCISVIETLGLKYRHSNLLSQGLSLASPIISEHYLEKNSFLSVGSTAVNAV